MGRAERHEPGDGRAVIAVAVAALIAYRLECGGGRPCYPDRGGIMKVRNSLRSLKSRPGSVVARRRGRMVVINRKNPRWNGRQG